MRPRPSCGMIPWFAIVLSAGQGERTSVEDGGIQGGNPFAAARIAGATRPQSNRKRIVVSTEDGNRVLYFLSTI